MKMSKKTIDFLDVSFDKFSSKEAIQEEIDSNETLRTIISNLADK